MSMLRRVSLRLLCCLVATSVECPRAAAAAIVESVTAFSTAEGFGAYAAGGRGGRVVEVTHLNDGGPGSLRAAMEASGPRIVVFRVSGTITLRSAIRLSTPYLTVAGQTSPGGVQVRGTGQPDGDWGVWLVNGTHDTIVRHLRVRMGGKMKHADVFDFRNNVIDNWSGNNASVFGQFALNSSAFGNVVGNLWLDRKVGIPTSRSAMADRSA